MSSSPLAFAVSAACTYNASFEDDVRACRETGIAGLGVWEFKLGNDDAACLDLFRNNGLTATYCFPETPGVIYGDQLFSSPTDRRERLRLLQSGIRRLGAFNPSAVICLAGPLRGVEEHVARRWVVEGLREAAYTAGELGVPLALEVIKAGPSGNLAPTVPRALDLIAEIDSEHPIRLLVDTWHFWEDSDALDEIRTNVGAIAGVQVCDYPKDCRGWFDRTLPGRGIMPLAEIIASLRTSGYDGWYEMEIFSDDGTFGDAYDDSLWRWPAADLLRVGRNAFDAVWEQSDILIERGSEQ